MILDELGRWKNQKEQTPITRIILTTMITLMELQVEGPDTSMVLEMQEEVSPVLKTG